MRFKELHEAKMDDGIQEYLEARGYIHLGDGLDQAAYDEPRAEYEDPSTGYVLKIFGSDFDLPNGRDPGHKMFDTWAAYCAKNARNPFLPKYSGWERFTWKGRTYLQIRMERLIELKLEDGIGTGLEKTAALLDAAIYDATTIKQHRANIMNVIGSDYPNSNMGLTHLMMMLGEKKFNLLLDTIIDISKIGKKNNWRLDLHDGNYMHRNDGVPVIVDPWVL